MFFVKQIKRGSDAIMEADGSGPCEHTFQVVGGRNAAGDLCGCKCSERLAGKMQLTGCFLFHGDVFC
jgi:hypothetical protein